METNTNEQDERAQLMRAEAAYARGDYRALAALARELARSSAPDVSARARVLLGAMGPDPVQVAVLVLCALALAAICWHYVGS
jgi:hypothetical protein